MAVFAVSIVKSVSYAGAQREFGNTYHYQTDVGQPFPDRELAEAVAEAERNVTSNEVNFVRWVTWGPTDGSRFDNVMREDGALSGTGDISHSNVPVYREVCSLVTWPLSRSPVTNRKRWLRKFLRMGVGASPSVESINGSGPLTVSMQVALETYAVDVLTPVGGALSVRLSTADGDEPVADPIVREYMYTRQIGN